MKTNLIKLTASAVLQKWTRTLVIVSLIITAATTAMSQNGVLISTTTGTADASAQLEVQSTNKGFLLPRMTAFQRTAIVTPATGLLVYQIDGAIGYYYYDGTLWIRISTTVGTITGVTASSPLSSTGGANPDISLSGIVPVANGGSGVDSLTGYLVGNGASPFTSTATIPTSDLSGTISNGQLANSSLNVTAGTGLTGGGTVALGSSTTIDMANTAVTAGTYGSSTSIGTFTVDPQGRLTSASDMTISASGIGAVTSVGTGTGLTGGPITGTGTISLANTAVSPGSYGTSTSVGTFTVDAQGRLTSAGNISIDANSLGAVTSASNGLTEVSNDVRLGGTLTAATTIAQEGFDFGFTGSGSVGIGTAAPGNKLEVVGAISGTAGVKTENGSAATPGFRFNNDANTGIFDPGGADILGLSTAGTERMRITATGNTGIGTTAPTATLSIGTGSINKLNIAGADGDMTFTDHLGSITFPAATAGNSPMIQMFASGTGNADRMVIAHSPGFPTYGLQYQDASDQFNFLSNGNNVMTVHLGTQNVGIGTAAPAQKLDVVGNVQFSGALMPAGNAGTIGQVLSSNGVTAPTWTSGFLRSNHSIDFQTASVTAIVTGVAAALPGLTRTLSLTAGDRVVVHSKIGIGCSVLGYGDIQLLNRVNGANLTGGHGAAGVDDDASFANWNTASSISYYDVPSTGSYTFTVVVSVARVSGTLTIGGNTGSIFNGVMELQVLKP